MELWRDRLDGALVVVGNAPTALFRLLELVEAGAPRPAAVIGVPVGFVGAAESKDALAEHPLGARAPRRPRPPRRQRDRRRPPSTRSRATRGMSAVDAPTTRASGRLFGVGVGPGDPELLTLKAARAIGDADVVAYPSARHGNVGRAADRRAVPARGPGRGAAEVPGHDRADATHPGGYDAAPARVLRRRRGRARRAPRRRPRRRGPVRGRPVLLRLLHVPARAARAALRDRRDPRRDGVQRRRGGRRHAAGQARRRVHGAARHAAARGARRRACAAPTPPS